MFPYVLASLMPKFAGAYRSTGEEANIHYRHRVEDVNILWGCSAALVLEEFGWFGGICERKTLFQMKKEVGNGKCYPVALLRPTITYSKV